MKNEPKLLFVLLVILFILAACSPSPVATLAPDTPAAEPPPTEEAPPAETETVPVEATEVIWYVRTDEVEQFWEQEIVIPGFEAAHPDVKINLVVVPWNEFDTQFSILSAAGTPPDVWSAWGSDNFADYVARGLVADLTPYIARDAYDLSDFFPEVLDSYDFDGKRYGLPMQTTASFVFYNKDMFDAAGVAYPPTSWDDTSWTYAAFVEKCAQLTANTDDPEQAVYGCLLDAWPSDQYALMFGQDLYPPEAYLTGFAGEAYLDSAGAARGLASGPH